VLSEILERISPGSTVLEADVQQEVLCKALGMEWEDAPAQTEKQQVPIRIYLPQCKEKVPSALRAFWQLVEQTQTPCEITLTDWGCFATAHLEQSVFQFVAEQMIRAAKRGFLLHILVPETDAYPEVQTLLRQLPLCLNPQMTYDRMPQDVTSPVNESWMTLGTQAVLLTRTLPGEAPISTLIQEQTLAQYYADWTQVLLMQTRPVNQHIGEGDVVQLYSRMKADVHPLMTVYFLESMPSFLHMPPQLLRTVMTENGADAEQIATGLRMSMLRTSLRSICKCTQIYDGDQILHGLGQERYVDPLLSGMLQRTAYITAEQLRQQLRFFLSEAEHTNYQIYLPSFATDFHLSQCGISVAVQEDSMAAVMDLTDRSRNFYSTDFSCVGGIACYIEQRVRMIPPVKRSGNWTRRLLKRYLQ
jgi:hypothetical protein